jgi:hypothetical protein
MGRIGVKIVLFRAASGGVYSHMVSTPIRRHPDTPIESRFALWLS